MKWQWQWADYGTERFWFYHDDEVDIIMGDKVSTIRMRGLETFQITNHCEDWEMREEFERALT